MLKFKVKSMFNALDEFSIFLITFYVVFNCFNQLFVYLLKPQREMLHILLLSHFDVVLKVNIRSKFNSEHS